MATDFDYLSTTIPDSVYCEEKRQLAMTPTPIETPVTDWFVRWVRRLFALLVKA